MKRRRGRRVAMWAAGLGILAILGATYAARDRILEPFWFNQLEHGDEEAQKAAATRLGEIQSARAIVPLIETMLRLVPDEEEAVYGRSGSDLRQKSERLRAERWKENWAAQALVAIGSASVEPLFNQLMDLGEASPVGAYQCCSRTLRALGQYAVPLLDEACSGTDDDIRVAACPLLRQIQGDTRAAKPVTAQVTSVVDGDERVLIDAGEDDGLWIGDQLTVSRDGSFVAVIQVVGSSAKSSIARVRLVRFGDKIVLGDSAATRIQSSDWQRK